MRAFNDIPSEISTAPQHRSHGSDRDTVTSIATIRPV